MRETREVAHGDRRGGGRWRLAVLAAAALVLAAAGAQAEDPLPRPGRPLPEPGLPEPELSREREESVPVPDLAGEVPLHLLPEVAIADLELRGPRRLGGVRIPGPGGGPPAALLSAPYRVVIEARNRGDREARVAPAWGVVPGDRQARVAGPPVAIPAGETRRIRMALDLPSLPDAARTQALLNDGFAATVFLAKPGVREGRMNELEYEDADTRNHARRIRTAVAAVYDVRARVDHFAWVGHSSRTEVEWPVRLYVGHPGDDAPARAEDALEGQVDRGEVFPLVLEAEETLGHRRDLEISLRVGEGRIPIARARKLMDRNSWRGLGGHSSSLLLVGTDGDGVEKFRARVRVDSALR